MDTESIKNGLIELLQNPSESSMISVVAVLIVLLFDFAYKFLKIYFLVEKDIKKTIVVLQIKQKYSLLATATAFISLQFISDDNIVILFAFLIILFLSMEYIVKTLLGFISKKTGLELVDQENMAVDILINDMITDGDLDVKVTKINQEVKEYSVEDLTLENIRDKNKFMEIIYRLKLVELNASQLDDPDPKSLVDLAIMYQYITSRQLSEHQDKFYRNDIMLEELKCECLITKESIKELQQLRDLISKEGRLVTMKELNDYLNRGGFNNGQK